MTNPPRPPEVVAAEDAVREAAEALFLATRKLQAELALWVRSVEQGKPKEGE